jgi:putative phosphoribosyl transferase
VEFADRADAGRQLASRLAQFEGADTLVLALPRGGVPVAFEVAVALHAPLDVFLVRKLGVPGHEELAMGAIASGGVRVVNRPVIEQLRIPRGVFDSVAASEQLELERRERAYRDQRPPAEVRHKVVIVIDDGLATGSTMRAAIVALRQHDPESIVVGVPVGAAATCAALRPEVDDVVCVVMPEPFLGVGVWYADFHQITDAEVRALLA